MGAGHKVFHPPTRKKKFVTDPTQPVSTNVSFFKNDHVNRQQIQNDLKVEATLTDFSSTTVLPIYY